jgi:hypothetical protein
MNSLLIKVSEVLEKYPRIRSIARKIYLFVNYIIFAKRDSGYKMDKKVRLYKFNDPELYMPGTSFFFGYYDKSPWSHDMKYYLLHKSEKSLQELKVCFWSFDEKRLQEIGRTISWNDQQGAMLQWVLKEKGDFVIFNLVIDGQLGSQIVDLNGKIFKVFNYPVQAVNHKHKKFLSLNYLRLGALRPDYGYKVEVENFRADFPDENDGIWEVDLETGKSKLLISIDWLRNHKIRKEMNRSIHKVNFCLFSPDEEKFIFLHRWRGEHGWFSRLYLKREDTDTPELLMDEKLVSHYYWIDNRSIIVYGRSSGILSYFKIDIEKGTISPFHRNALDKYGDGHPSISLNGKFLITDSYPDRARNQHLLYLNLASSSIIEAGEFFEPIKFDGVTRIDLHPRISPDCKLVSIDAGFEGARRNYILDISGLIK